MLISEQYAKIIRRVLVWNVDLFSMRHLRKPKSVAVATAKSLISALNLNGARIDTRSRKSNEGSVGLMNVLFLLVALELLVNRDAGGATEVTVELEGEQ